jgi:hypothetical protein
MELTKKTTILFSPALHQHLTQLAAQRGTSLGALVGEAREREYGPTSQQERLATVRTLGLLGPGIDAQAQPADA